MGKRKPFLEIVEAFTAARGDHLRLLIRGQVDRKAGRLEKAAGGDDEVIIELEDRPTDEHLRQFASCDVCLSPSRWRASACRFTRRSRSASRRSPTTRRR